MTDKQKKILTILFLFAIILLVGIIVLLFIPEKGNNDKSSNEDSDVIIEYGFFNLSSDNQEFILNDKSINLKVDDSLLYINDKVVENVDALNISEVFITDKYILIGSSGICGYYFSYGILDDGSIININNSIVLLNDDVNSNEYDNVVYKNGLVYADLLVNCFCVGHLANDCPNTLYEVEVVFRFDGESIIVEAVKNG